MPSQTLEALAYLLFCADSLRDAEAADEISRRHVDRTYWNAPRPEHAEALKAREVSRAACTAAAQRYGRAQWLITDALGLETADVDKRLDQLAAGEPTIFDSLDITFETWPTPAKRLTQAWADAQAEDDARGLARYGTTQVHLSSDNYAPDMPPLTGDEDV